MRLSAHRLSCQEFWLVWRSSGCISHLPLTLSLSRKGRGDHIYRGTAGYLLKTPFGEERYFSQAKDVVEGGKIDRVKLKQVTALTN